MKRIGLALLFAVTPLAANAAIIQVDYVGSVDNSTWTGFFAAGDPVSGTMFIDSALYGSSVIDPLGYALYYGSSASSLKEIEL